MNKQNIFQKDVVVPDIVWIKAGETLADLPDYPVIARSDIKENRRSKRMLIRVVALACVAVVLIFFIAKNRFNNGPFANTFTITVNAQEMEDGGSLPLNIPDNLLGEQGWSSCPDFLEFPLNFDILGDEVQSVEYSFFNSFCLVEHSGMKSELFHGSEIKPFHDFFVVVPSDNPRCYPETRFYNKYTISYPFTDKKDFVFNLVKEMYDRPDLEQMYDDLQQEVLSETEMQDGSIRYELKPRANEEAYANYFGAVLKDVAVTITVHFSNGAVETRNIGFRGALIEEPSWTLNDGTVVYREGIECFFLTDEEAKKIVSDNSAIQYEKNT